MIFGTSVFKMKQELYIALGSPHPQQNILGVWQWHSFGKQGLDLKVCFRGNTTLGFFMLADDYY
jgi:hypothetical protein